MEWIAAVDSCPKLFLISGKKRVGTIPCVDILKIIPMNILKCRPRFWAFLNNRCNDFIGLGKVVVKVNMLEPLRNTAPAVHFLFWEFVNIVCNFFVANQHQMELKCTTAVAFLGKILQHFGIADGCLGDAGFQVFAEFVIYNIEP